MLKPIDEVTGNSKTLQKIEQVKIQVVAKLFMLYFTTNSIKPQIKQGILNVIKENQDYWRAKWCIRIRKGLLEKKPLNEYSFYLVVASALLNEEQLNKPATPDHPNYEAQQFVLIIGSAMKIMNSIQSSLEEKKTIDDIEKEVIFHCLLSFVMVASYIQCLHGGHIVEDFVEYVLFTVSRVLKMTWIQDGSELSKLIYKKN